MADQGIGPIGLKHLDRFIVVCLLVSAFTSTFAISLTQIFLGLSMLGFLTRLGWALFSPENKSSLIPEPTGLEGPVLAMLVWAVSMIPLSGDRAQSLIFMRRFFLFFALFIGAFAAGRDKESGRSFQRNVLVALLVGGAGTGLFGLFQFFNQGGAYIDPWDGFLKNRVVLLQGYMTGAGLMMLASLVALGFLLVPQKNRSRLYLLLAMAPMFISLIFTLTRSAWLGFAVGAAVMVLLAGRRVMSVVMLVTVLGILLTPGLGRDRLLSAFDADHYQNSPRVEMWQTGGRMVADHPFTGVGDRDLNELYWAYEEREAGGPVDRSAYPTGPTRIVGHMHNNFVQLAVIWGIPGLVFSLFFLLSIPRHLTRWWRKSTSKSYWVRGWILAAIGAWAGFMTAGMFEWYFGDAEVAQLMWLITGVALGAGRWSMTSQNQTQSE
jgi:putative inorganic carbon (hco3(-)) transporter